MRLSSRLAGIFSVVPLFLFSTSFLGDPVDRYLAAEIEDDAICEAEDCGLEDPCSEECWCRYIKYEPRYYTVQKCIEKQIPVKRKACRIVPKQYNVQRCRYVPEYYSETITKNEVEYYYVDDWKTIAETVVEQKCEWVPKCYWKKVLDSDSGRIDEEYCEEVLQQDE